MKLVLALALTAAAPSALAMAPYGPIESFPTGPTWIKIEIYHDSSKCLAGTDSNVPLSVVDCAAEKNVGVFKQDRYADGTYTLKAGGLCVSYFLSIPYPPEYANDDDPFGPHAQGFFGLTTCSDKYAEWQKFRSDSVGFGTQIMLKSTEIDSDPWCRDCGPTCPIRPFLVMTTKDNQVLAAGGGGYKEQAFNLVQINKCAAACEWGASAPYGGNPEATCGTRVEWLMDNGVDAVTACGIVATESPEICGGCACGEACD